jgi:prepilin-type N-terminal cleavage/methylation domain-containing protein
MQKFEEVRKKRKQQGFTLMEMLVVVMIMGFLLAMIAPRFTNFFDGAQQTLCKSNSKASFKVLETFVYDSGNLPDYLLTLAACTNASDPDTYTRGEWYDGSDPDQESGVDVSKGLYLKNAMVLHTLNESEADALRSMGIKKIAPIREGNGTDAVYPGDYVDVANGAQVMMIGAAATSNSTEIEAKCVTGTNTVAPGGPYGLTAVGKHLANPELAYRMVLGLGPDNELVTSGALDQAGVGMGVAKEQGDNPKFHYGYHTIVLPRLQESLNRLATGAPTKIEVAGYDKAGSGQKKIKGARVITLNEAQKASDYDILGNCGSTWREHNQMTGEAQWKITAIEETN